MRLSVLANVTDNIEFFGSVRYNEWDVGNNNWRAEIPNQYTYSRERDLTFAGRHTRETYAGTWEVNWNSFANFYNTTSVLTVIGLPPGDLAILDTVLGDTSIAPSLADEQLVRIYFPFENRYREIEHLGAFFSANIAFKDHWELGIGIRADDWTSNTLDRDAGLYGTGVPFLEQGDTEFLPKVSLSYTADSGTMTYFTIAKGYEPGGYNLYDPVGTPLLNPFFAEEVTSYELGLKTSLLDDTLTLNVAGFYIDYKDRQFEIQQQIAIG